MDFGKAGGVRIIFPGANGIAAVFDEVVSIQAVRVADTFQFLPLGSAIENVEQAIMI